MRWCSGPCDLLRRKFFVLLVLIGCSDGYLNIFISQSQVMKLLGLEAELYYVREGVVNTYAMNFVVPVPANIADLEFSWQSLVGHPLPYSMELDYDIVGVPSGPSSGIMALLPPRVNVSARGEVPVTLQVFRIRLPCSGISSAEIPLALRLNVTAPPGTKYNDTILVFKRNKICLKGVETPPSNDSVRLEPGPLVNGAGALYVAATCACALILVVGSVASALYIRNSKARVQESHKNYIYYCFLSVAVPIVAIDGVVGEKAQLPCDIRPAENDEVRIVFWYKEGRGEPFYSFDVRGRRKFTDGQRWSSPNALGPRAFFATMTNPAYLSIDRLQSTDEGIYRCRVDFKNSPTRKQKMNLTIIVPPSKPIIRDGATRNVWGIEEPYNEGSDVNLICEVHGGKPLPKLTWYLDNTVIDESYHYNAETGLTVNHLVYAKIGRQHLKARLICQASNTNLMPPQTRLLILNVNLKPLIVQILTKETRVSADKNYEVECRTSGSRPDAVITWWKANKQIKKKTQNYALENNQTLSVLSFVPTIEDDGKYLTCRAENPVISDSALEDKWRLDVQYQPVVNLRMGETLNPDDIKEGDDVYFECKVRANPKVYKLAWFKDKKELKNNSTAGVILSDQSLVLQGLTRYSAGDYTCLAVNSEGKTESNSVSLQIMYAPVCKEGKSEVVVGALKQETVSLVCSVESHPAPLTFHWTFNNSGELVEVPHSRYSHVPAPGTPSVADSLKEYQQFHGSRLNYTPATEMDYGTVACWASNQVGKQRTPCLFQVIAAGRPYALLNCSATEMSAPLDVEELGTKSGTGLVVRCLEGYDGGLPIYSYQLEVVADEDGGPILLNKTVPASPNGPTFEVAGLTTGRSYRLFLYAINAKGRSEPAILEPVTLKGVAMYTTGNTDASMLNPLLLGLAAMATLLALAVAGILAALYRKHSAGRPGSPKHAPIVCEPPNAGATTPVHPQTKQAVDDIDPDIIPNEYERRPLTYTPVYKTPPQRRKKDRAADEDASPEKRPIVQHGLDLPPDPMLTDCLPTPTINYPQNHVSQQSTYGHPPTMADFKQMAMDAYNQRNNQNIYYSLQRTSKGLPSMPQRPVSSSVSAQGKFHQPEVVTRSNRIQESCI